MKTSLVCLMALATVMGLRDVSGTRVCTPNALFDLQCNKCVCSADGSTYACTKMFCPMIKSFAPVCVPNSYFKEDCNYCACSTDGKFKTCTEMACARKIREPDTDNEIPQTRVCEPNSHFKDYCNSCFCSADGLQVACTRMACDKDIFNKDGTLKTRFNTEITKENAEPKMQICEPHSNFKDYCNYCRCSSDGTEKACTKMRCDETIFNPDGSLKAEETQDGIAVEEIESENRLAEEDAETECEPNSSFKEYCNNCFCSKDGKSKACTRMFCDPAIFHKNGSIKVSEAASRDIPTRFARSIIQKPKNAICEPGQSFKNYCNTCGCSEDGASYVCTRMYCDPEIFNEDGSLRQGVEEATSEPPKQVCEPNRLYKDYCNTCQCSPDGLSTACTLIACDESVFNKDGSMKQPPAEEAHSESRRVCEPNQVFKEYCNTCKCSADGLTKACTFIACDKNLFNQDGTLKVQPKKLCEPNTTFKDYCNTCRCSSDGLLKSCTMIACDTRIYNPDGSMKSRIA